MNDKTHLAVSAMRMIDEATDFLHCPDGQLPPPYPTVRDGEPQYPPDWADRILTLDQRKLFASRRIRDALAYGMRNAPTLTWIIADKPEWATNGPTWEKDDE